VTILVVTEFPSPYVIRFLLVNTLDPHTVPLPLLHWRSHTGQPFLSDTVRSRRLSFFGHLHRTGPSQDNYRALQACIMGPPDDWRWRIGHPRQCWLRTVEANLRPMNLGLATSKQRAQVRLTWWKLIAMATSSSTTNSWRERTESALYVSRIQCVWLCVFEMSNIDL